jgi:Iap family predicted aminopeptidase
VCLTLQQKIVIKVPMASDRSRSKAMALVAAAGGVDSVAIAGAGKDQVVDYSQYYYHYPPPPAPVGVVYDPYSRPDSTCSILHNVDSACAYV